VAWVHFVTENFCMFDSCKDKYTKMGRFKQDENGELIRDKKGFYVTEQLGLQKNPVYLKGKRPKWCEKKTPHNHRKDMTPKYECLYDKCPFLSMMEVDKSEYMVMINAWEKAGKDGAFDHLEGCLPPKSKNPRKQLNGRKPPAK